MSSRQNRLQQREGVCANADDRRWTTGPSMRNKPRRRARRQSVPPLPWHLQLPQSRLARLRPQHKPLQAAVPAASLRRQRPARLLQSRKACLREPSSESPQLATRTRSDQRQRPSRKSRLQRHHSRPSVTESAPLPLTSHRAQLEPPRQRWRRPSQTKRTATVDRQPRR